MTLLEKLQADPNIFFREVLGSEPEEYQERINTAIAMYERVAISSCHDLGKSWDIARILIWFTFCFEGAKVISTAPTFNQVQNILWAEVRSAHAKAKAKLGGKMNLTEWQLSSEGDWFAIGFTSRNAANSGAGQGVQSDFQGFHAPYLMVIFDEATGIPDNIWTMAEGLLTSGRVKFICIGNPTSRSSKFYKCFSSPDWHKIKLTCFDSPNLKLNGIETIEDLKREINTVTAMPDLEAQERLKSYRVVKNHLLSLKWVVQMGLPRNWGVEHPLFVSKVLGEFPSDSDNTLISLGTVEAAQLSLFYPDASSRKVIGIDVARFGSDASIFTALHGKKFLDKRKFLKHDTTSLSGEAIALATALGGVDVIVVDETGLGGGLVDVLRQELPKIELLRNVEVRGIQFGSAVECDGGRECTHDTCAKSKFVNVKAQMFRFLADDLKNGLTLPHEDIYLDELPTLLYRYDSRGRMYLESKDEYKKRTGRGSPDHADSLALANFGNYDELVAGKFGDAFQSGYGTPFAASLRGQRTW